MAQILTKVVFPAPFLPRSVNIWPGSTFIETLFKSKPKQLVFGSHEIQRLAFIIGEKYFMAIDSSFSFLSQDPDFIPSFQSISEAVMKDLRLHLKKSAIQESLEYASTIVDNLNFDALLASFQVFSKTSTLTGNETKLKMWQQLFSQQN